MQAEGRDDGRSLELVVGRGVPVELRQLIGASEHFSAVINEVAKAYTGRDKGVRWIVEVKPGSVRLPVRPEPATKEVQPSAAIELPDLIGEGVAQLGREAVRPEYFTDRALEQLRDLANMAKEDFPLAVQNGHGSISLTAQVSVNVGKILGKPRTSIGTVEGRLEAVSLHEGAQFSIWPVKGKQIKCKFGRYVSLDEVLAAVNKRVSARGRIKTRPDGVREWVEVHSLRVLDPQGTDADDVSGIFHGREATDW